MTVARRLRWGFALPLVLAACGPSASPIDAPRLDTALFAREVQSVLGQRCATPACHGNVHRPLRVFATGYLRADPTRVHIAEPISAEELNANYLSASAFADGIARPEDSLLVTKPLGNARHTPVFVSVEDRDSQTLVRWLATRAGGYP